MLVAFVKGKADRNLPRASKACRMVLVSRSNICGLQVQWMNEMLPQPHREVLTCNMEFLGAKAHLH